VVLAATIGVLAVGRLGFGVPLPRQPAGLWTPQMSPSMLHIGQFTPLGAAAQALRDRMAGGWPHPAALLVLGGCTLARSGLALRFFRWE